VASGKEREGKRVRVRDGREGRGGRRLHPCRERERERDREREREMVRERVSARAKARERYDTVRLSEKEMHL